MTDRIQALIQKINAYCDAALLVSEENRRYFTGFSAAAGRLLVTADGTCVFWTDSRYLEAAAKEITCAEVRDNKDVGEQLRTIFAEKGIRRVAVEGRRMTVQKYNSLQKELPDAQWLATEALEESVDALRSVKSDEELAAICGAQRIAEAAFAEVLGIIAPGRTEREIALELEYTMLRMGARALSFPTIAVGGTNSSMPHGVPGDRPLAQGDFLTLDFGAVLDGYHSDMTRTVLLGQPTVRQREVYETVLRAQEATLAMLRDGVTGIEADAAAREVITAAGYGDCFGHGVGHGVGIEIHEAPRLSPSAPHTLHAGNVVTVEPGIYLPGEFGVRIEDMVLITPTGIRNLTQTPKQLLCL